MFSSLAMFESPTQWIIILAIVLVLFGSSRIPELMKGLGTGMKEFKKGIREDEEEAKPKVDATKAEAPKIEGPGTVK